MVRFFCAIAVLVGAAMPLRAESLPQGDFMLGTYVWPDTVLPRYVMLRIEGDVVRVEFSYPLPLDYAACEDLGVCEFYTVAATARAEMVDEAVRLDDIDVIADAGIDPDLLQRYGKPDHQFYTYPLLGLVHGAALEETEVGFQLDGAGGPLEFFRVEGIAREAAMVISVAYEVSISGMAHCEVRSIVPLFLDGGQDAVAPEFMSVLSGFKHQWELGRVRPAPLPEDASPAEMLNQTLSVLGPRMPHMAASFAPESGAPFREPLWDVLGEKAFLGDRAAFDALLAGYGESLEAMVVYSRALKVADPQITSQSVCTDPTLGLFD